MDSKNAAQYEAGYGDAAAKFAPVEAAIIQVRERTDLTPRQKRQIMNKLLRPIRGEMREVKYREQDTKRKYAMFTDFISLMESEPKLERATSSNLHNALESLANGTAVYHGINRSDEELKSWFLGSSEMAHCFVVQHDWAAAFKDAEEFGDGEFRLPFDSCCFEFRINSHKMGVIVLDGTALMAAYFEHPGGYILVDLVKSEAEAASLKLLDLVWRQIRAISIMLDAAVAAAETIRAPYRLNEIRIKQQRQPLRDYHIISLAHRHRTLPNSEETHSSRQRRLHFRRGHWRHYETFKTWVRWCLVGNPDLGFVDKEYRI